MKVTWLGQAGLLFEGRGIKVMVDPYLSDSCGEINPNSHRRIPVEESLFDIKPDVIVLTHDHLDHTDEQTLVRFLKDTKDILVLAAPNAWTHARQLGGEHNYVRMGAFTSWTHFSGVRFDAVPADHSDTLAIGVIIDDGKKKYYVTGDTLYNAEILKALPKDIDSVFLPINGVGNNMNATDASRFAEAVGAKNAVPLHFGLFDSVDPHSFTAKSRVIPRIYQEIPLE